MKRILPLLGSLLLALMYSCAGQECYAQSSVVVATTVACATSIDGTVVGVPNPLNPPIVAAAFSGTLPAGNYYTQIGWYDAAGHVTLAGPEVQTQLTGTGQLQVNLPSSGMPSASVGMKVYIGASSGAETLQGSTTGAATFTQSTPLTSGTVVPATNATICAIIANDAGWPAGTGYAVSMTTPAGNTVPGYPMQWQLLGPGTTINLGNGLPLYNGTVTYPIPILARPYNHAPQSISGSLSMTNFNITQVGKIGVGTSVPGWSIDVENGPVNASGGYILNGGSGVSPGQCLAAGSDPYHTFNIPVNCVTSSQTLYYQTVLTQSVPLQQRDGLDFSAAFNVVNESSSETLVDLARAGTSGTYTNPTSITTDAYGRVTSISTGSTITAVQSDVTSSRFWNIAYQNTTAFPMFVSGYASSPGGSSTGSITCTVGSSSPTNAIWSDEHTATVSNAHVAWECGNGPVPAGWFYEVTVTGDTSSGPVKWIETTIQ